MSRYVLLALCWFAPLAQAGISSKATTPVATPAAEEPPAGATAPCAANERSANGVCQKILATRPPTPNQPDDDEDDEEDEWDE